MCFSPVSCRHENRMTVVHFTVQRSGEYDEPIKSKTPMIISSGKNGTNECICVCLAVFLSIPEVHHW